ncbi:MAG: 23S rRNA (uracil(1939)-C(5))-methyltransferase RlmD [Clostridia bacterium]|nr:23S rRNA (uracil(1939)-C(5))-methyltransferase RlmD [Clostridia bacterium]
MPEKNMTYEGKVTDITVNGDGVVKIDSYPVFVSGAVIGDEISFVLTKTNKTYGFGKLKKIITPSNYRRTPPCPSFPACGGCTLMHTSYRAQLEYKQNFVLSNLTRLGGYSEEEFLYEPIIGAENEFFYRNKAQFPVGISKGKAVCGFFAPKSHEIIPCGNCHIQNETINKAVECVLEHINDCRISTYNEKTHKGFVRHIYVRYGEKNGELMVCIVTNSNDRLAKSEDLAKKLSPLGLKSLVQNVNTKKTNVILGDKNIVLYGDSSINIKVDDLTFKVNPHSFFQVNTQQMKKLYSKALEYSDITESDVVFDLYCGVGSISLYLAKKAKKVIGVEIVPQAIENAKENAKLSNVNNTEFYCGDCTEVVTKLIDGGEKADVVVVDPPRKGCDEKLFELVEKISPKKLVYVSCNSATLARDLVILKEKGYILQKACAVDMFPQTGHVEAVALMSKK